MLTMNINDMINSFRILQRISWLLKGFHDWSRDCSETELYGSSSGVNTEEKNQKKSFSTWLEHTARGQCLTNCCIDHGNPVFSKLIFNSTKFVNKRAHEDKDVLKEECKSWPVSRYFVYKQEKE